MTRRRVVPDDISGEPAPKVLPGAQPKLLMRETSGRYSPGLTAEEFRTRYKVCEDLLRQFSTYASRQMRLFGRSFADVFATVERSVNRVMRTVRCPVVHPRHRNRLTKLMMATRYKRTKATIDTSELLLIPASAGTAAKQRSKPVHQLRRGKRDENV